MLILRSVVQGLKVRPTTVLAPSSGTVYYVALRAVYFITAYYTRLFRGTAPRNNSKLKQRLNVSGALRSGMKTNLNNSKNERILLHRYI